MTQKKQFKDLNLSNAFLFGAALEDSDTCRLVLELILGEAVGPVSVKPERSVLFSSDFRCVRFDIFASDEFAVGYDLEMQNTDERNLPKRIGGTLYVDGRMDATGSKSKSGRNGTGNSARRGTEEGRRSFETCTKR